MPTLLLRHADLLVTMDDAEQIHPDGAIYCVDGRIAQVGPTDRLPGTADRVIDARGRIVLPGLVNTHHHFFQTLTRALPAAQNGTLFQWLTALYPIWAGITPEAMRVSTQVALAELMLSGCTTASDHTYLWPNGARLDDQIEAASEMGVRFHAARGSMSLGQSQGGLPPDGLVEDDEAILRDTRRAVEQYHDPAPRAMTRVVVAPCSPFSVSPQLMRESAALARAYGVHLHTHLAETLDEERYCRSRFGRRPAEYAEHLDWTGPDVWHAHCVHLSDEECARLGRTRTGAAHCPSSNMRLASGVAPLRAMLAGGMRVGLGVDGSASNDAGHLLGEARQAMLLQRVARMDPGALTAREALRLATRGGAEVLGRDDVGQLAPGMAADLIAYRLDTLPYAGAAVHDPVAALVFCQPQTVDLSVIDGAVQVEDGTLRPIELERLVERQNALARRLVRGER